jgi:metal-responsive CopG/Arc/MetJ family transcriptional regulator
MTRKHSEPYTVFSISLPTAISDIIEQRRGPIKRSTFIQEIICEYLLKDDSIRLQKTAKQQLIEKLQKS